eukprot:5034568-Amphidinium_carterae.1
MKVIEYAASDLQEVTLIAFMETLGKKLIGEMNKLEKKKVSHRPRRKAPPPPDRNDTQRPAPPRPDSDDTQRPAPDEVELSHAERVAIAALLRAMRQYKEAHHTHEGMTCPCREPLHHERLFRHIKGAVNLESCPDLCSESHVTPLQCIRILDVLDRSFHCIPRAAKAPPSGATRQGLQSCLHIGGNIKRTRSLGVRSSQSHHIARSCSCPGLGKEIETRVHLASRAGLFVAMVSESSPDWDTDSTGEQPQRPQQHLCGHPRIIKSGATAVDDQTGINNAEGSDDIMEEVEVASPIKRVKKRGLKKKKKKSS